MGKQKSGAVNVHFEFGVEHVVALVLMVVLFFGAQLIKNPGLTGAIVLPPSGNLSCQFVEMGNFSCPGGFTKIFGMSAQENAHVELFNESNYNISVCCQDLAAANQMGVGSDGTGVLNISNFTNAHAELPTAGFYPVPIFLNASNASIGCSVNMTGEGSCPTGFACMGTLSNDTNAHVSNCTSPGRYNITVCCSIGALITSYLAPNTAPTNNLTANGSTNGTLVENETSYETQDITFLNVSDSNKRFLLITGQFNLSNVDARGLVVEFNQSALAVNLSSVTGDTDNHTLYLANNANNLGVHVCPTAESLAGIVPSCASEANFTGPFPQTIGATTVLQDGSDFRIENVNGSGAELLTTINTSLSNTNLTNSTAIDSVLNDSSMTDSSSVSSTKLNVTMINSTNINSVISFAIETDTILTGVTATNCRFGQDTIFTSTCLNSILTGLTGSGWGVDPSVVTNSSCAAPCTINESNVLNSVLNNVVINASNVSDSVVTNAFINNSNLTNSNATAGSELHNSTVDFSNIVGLRVFNANITNQFCFYGFIIKGATTYNCPIALSVIYNPPFGPGGGGSSGAGAGAGAAAAAATSTAAAAAAATSTASAATASMSVQAAVSTGALGQCQTTVPKVTGDRPPIPQGYVLLGRSDFTCFGSVADFTINLPDKYKDLRAIRCRGGVCGEVESNRSRDQVLCGNETVKEIRDAEVGLLRPNITVEVPIEIGEDRYLSETNPATIIGPYQVALSGAFPPRFTTRLHMAGAEVPLPPNPQVIVLNPPLRIGIADAHLGAWINVTVPIVTGVDLGTLTLATYHNGEWVLLGGEYDAVNGSVHVTIDDVSRYADNGVATFALLGVVCEACTQGELVRDYTDGSSRRAVILVHGLTANSMKFGTLIDDFRLTGQPWQVWTFRYPFNESMEHDAKELSDLLTLHSQEFDEVYLLGHSLGGLIAQQALVNAYEEQKAGSNAAPWLPKVKRAIIVGTPNRGSPTADVYRALLTNLFNLSTTASPFDVQSTVIDDLAYGRSIAPVPGIDYQVIVGTRPIPFTERLFSGQTNDGVLTPESGSTLGDVSFHDACKDYYAINITHVDLDDHPTAIRVIQRILNKQLSQENPNLPLVGYNQYLRVSVGDCSPSDSYFIIGKPILAEQAFDPLLCECGNKYCNEGETPENCPSDCASISLLAQSCVGILIAGYPLIVLVALLLLWRYALRALRKSRGKLSRRALWTAQGILTVLAVIQPFACQGTHLEIVFAAGVFLVLTVLDAIPGRHKVGESAAKVEVVEGDLSLAAIGSLSPKSRERLLKSLGKNAPQKLKDALKQKETAERAEAKQAKDAARAAKQAEKAGKKAKAEGALVPREAQAAPQANQQPQFREIKVPHESFSERLESVRQRVKRRYSYWKEGKRLDKLAKDTDLHFGDQSKVDNILEGLPEEVKKKLQKRKK